MNFGPALKAVERLVTRIVAGQAVFFVGAGFSLDSEPNTSRRLIRRLIARFAAITEQLGNTPQSEAPQLRKGLSVTFGLSKKALASKAMVSDKTIQKLEQDYYKINDWICSAFTILLRELQSSKVQVLEEIRKLENDLLAIQDPKGNAYDKEPLDSIDIPGLIALGPDSGKGLFLDTMGFGDKSGKIWGGEPRVADLGDVLKSYGTKLLDRQYVISRLAREGLAPLILTTNFDLLLEGACRTAGFKVIDRPESDANRPTAAYERVLVIAGAADFFEQGGGYRSAMLVKIHGSVHRYREERDSPERLARYLPSMVFTYREIQNWRKDSWSRDLVSTLLRTRTIVLCGYSGADPVVHDTFRTVYEEIAAQREAGIGAEANTPRDARAFFTGRAGKSEFAGLEILRAGSRAAGVVEPKLFGHPNYLPFYLPKEKRFPTLDELFLWIYHRSLRRLQMNAIRSDLRRIAVPLLQAVAPAVPGEPALQGVAPADLELIGSAFRRLCAHEVLRARRWESGESSRRHFQQVTAWTNDFHVALLREFALMETVSRNKRSGMRIHEFRSRTVYHALLDRPGWGAWGAVVELALRRMGGATEGRKIEIVPYCFPVALVTRPAEFTRTAVILTGPGSGREAAIGLPGLYRRVHEWQMMSWITKDPVPGTPSAYDIWRWAFFPASELEKEPPCAWFGESDDRKSEGARPAAGGAQGRTLRSKRAVAQKSGV
jgi:SIR2-like domain